MAVVDTFICHVVITLIFPPLCHGSTSNSEIGGIRQEIGLKKPNLPNSTSWPAMTQWYFLPSKMNPPQTFPKSQMKGTRDISSHVTRKFDIFNNHQPNVKMDADIKMNDSVKKIKTKNTSHDLHSRGNYFPKVRKSGKNTPFDTELEELSANLTLLLRLTKEVLIKRLISGLRCSETDVKQTHTKFCKFYFRHTLDTTVGTQWKRKFVNSLMKEINRPMDVVLSENIVSKNRDIRPKQKFNLSGLIEKIPSYITFDQPEFLEKFESSFKKARFKRNAYRESADMGIGISRSEIESIPERSMLSDAEPSNHAKTFNNVQVVDRTILISTDTWPNENKDESFDASGREASKIDHFKDITDTSIVVSQQHSDTGNASAGSVWQASPADEKETTYPKIITYGSDTFSASNNVSANLNYPTGLFPSWQKISTPTSSVHLTGTAISTVHGPADKDGLSVSPKLPINEFHLKMNTNQAETAPEKVFKWQRQDDSVTQSGAALVTVNISSNPSISSFIHAGHSDKGTDQTSSSSNFPGETQIGPMLSRSVENSWDTPSPTFATVDPNIAYTFHGEFGRSEQAATRNSNISFDDQVTSMSPFHTRSARPTSRDNTFPPVMFGPNWEVAKQTLRYAWEIHVYFLGAIFGLVSLYNMLSIASMWRARRLLPFGYFLTVHALILCVCFTRSIYLLYDGYNSRSSYPVGLNQFLYRLTFPSLTSVFSVFAYWLLDTTQTTCVPSSLQKLQVLVPVIVVHYLVSVITYALAGHSTGIQVMQFLCQVFFVVWGSFLFFGYAYIFRKLYSAALKHQGQVLSLSSISSSTVDCKVKCRLTIGMATKAMFLSSICGLAIVGLEAYAVVGVYNTFTRDRPKLWPWWLYHTVVRLIELVMCVFISFAASLPLESPVLKRKGLSGILRVALSTFCCCIHKRNNTGIVAGWREFEEKLAFNTAHSGSIGSFTEVSADRVHKSCRVDPIPASNIQPTVKTEPDAILIIDDVYVSFQTDLDINRIVDSANYFTQSPGDVHKINTFCPQNDFNNACLINPSADKDRRSSIDERVYDKKYPEFDDANSSNKSPKNSVGSNEFFRVHSSVSIADSMEKEMVKAFESFREEQY